MLNTSSFPAKLANYWNQMTWINCVLKQYVYGSCTIGVVHMCLMLWIGIFSNVKDTEHRLLSQGNIQSLHPVSVKERSRDEGPSPQGHLKDRVQTWSE